MKNNLLKNLIVENDNNITSLTYKQQEEINKYVRYIRANGISLYDSELFRKDLIQLYFEHFIRDESIDSSDTMKLCNSYIENCTKHRIEPLLYVLYYFSSAALLYFVFDLFFSQPNIISAFTLFRGILTLLIITLSYFVLPRFTSSSKRNRIILYLFVSLCILVLIVVPLLINQTVPSLFIVPVWIRLVSHLLFFILMAIIWTTYNRKLIV